MPVDMSLLKQEHNVLQSGNSNSNDFKKLFKFFNLVFTLMTSSHPATNLLVHVIVILLLVPLHDHLHNQSFSYLHIFVSIKWCWVIFMEGGRWLFRGVLLLCFLYMFCLCICICVFFVFLTSVIVGWPGATICHSPLNGSSQTTCSAHYFLYFFFVFVFVFVKSNTSKIDFSRFPKITRTSFSLRNHKCQTCEKSFFKPNELRSHSFRIHNISSWKSISKAPNCLIAGGQELQRGRDQSQGRNQDSPE